MPIWVNRVPISVRLVKSSSCCLLYFAAGWLSLAPNFHYWAFVELDLSDGAFPPSACVNIKIQHVTRLACFFYLLRQPEGAAPSRRRRQQKVISEGQNNDQIKAMGLFSFSPRSLPLPLSSFLLSFFNLCLPVFVSDTPIFTQITRSKNPKWVSFHDKQINFYRLESCWSWKCSALFKTRRALEETPSSSLFEPPQSCFLCQHCGSFLSSLTSISGEIQPGSHLVKVKSFSKRQECCRAQRRLKADHVRAPGPSCRFSHGYSNV